MREVILQNNNSKTIGKLSRRYLTANRGRNLIAILAIALTTMMFTSLFTIGSGFLDVQQRQTMRQVGSSAHGGFKYITWEEHDKLKTHPDIKAYGSTIFAAMAENAALAKVHTEVRWADENYAKWNFSMPTSGKLPENENELATSTVILDALGVPHELGATVPLEFTIDSKQYQKEFFLSGFWAGDPAFHAHSVFLAKSYIDQVVTVSTQNFFDRANQGPEKSLQLDVMLGSSTNIESKLNEILADNGYTPDRFELAVNWAYLGSGAPDASMILIVAIVLLLIGGAGYLIIYNVFYISVTRDIRNYGLLKTLGTTPRQLRSLVRRQAWLLSAAGIPLGIVLGYGMGYLLLPALLSITSLAGEQIPLSVNLWIPLGAALFSLFTVWISCKNPCKLAATVSPIEALRTHEASQSKQKSRRSGRLSTAQMAWHNVTRGKKRVVAVVLSLTLSIVLLNSVYGATKSFDIDKFMANNILTDFSLAEGKMLSQYEMTYLDRQIIADLSGQPGVKTASPVFMQEYQLPPEQRITDAVTKFTQASTDLAAARADELVQQAQTYGLTVHLYGIDRFLYEKLEFAGEKPGWEQFASGNYLLATPIKFTSDIGTPVFADGETVTLQDRDGNNKQYTALAAAEVPPPSTPLHGHITDIALILPVDEYQKNFLQDSLIYLHLEAEETAIPALEKTLAAYCEPRTVDYNSRATYMAEFTGLQNTYLLVGGALGGILGLVGILNFVNSIITAILTRKTELAMLQSVGMTTKQLRRMLIGEGLWYIALTSAATLTLGNLLSAFITNVIAGQMWFFTFHFTMLPMLVVLPLLVIPAVLIPVTAYRTVSRQSVVERLREL